MWLQLKKKIVVENGLNSMLPIIPHIDVAIVGEPTLMQLAVAEKGLVVFDAVVAGTPSHAAHPNTNNAIYNSIEVLQWFQNFKFKKTSKALGDVKMTVTQIAAGSQHNVVPAQVNLVVDVRVNDAYSNQEIASILQAESPCTKITPRSLRLNSSAISTDHELVKAGIAMGRTYLWIPYIIRSSSIVVSIAKIGPWR